MGIKISLLSAEKIALRRYFFRKENLDEFRLKNLFKKNFEKGIDFSKKSVIIIIVKRRGRQELQAVATLEKVEEVGTKSHSISPALNRSVSKTCHL